MMYRHYSVEDDNVGSSSEFTLWVSEVAWMSDTAHGPGTHEGWQKLI
jgi:hypothetical protein